MAKRDEAIMRGLEFIYATARDPSNFADYGFDYTFCLHWIASTSRNRALRRAARSMAVDCARRWREGNPTVPEDADAETVAQAVFGGLTADRLGLRDAAFRREVRRAAANVNVCDVLWFDPADGPPPDDLPKDCACGEVNARGRATCRGCRRRLKRLSRYEVWLLALIRSYLGERYGVKLGAGYEDVLGWLPSMRPYPERAGGYDDFIWAVYAVTHVVYTLNGYSTYKLSPRWLPDEYEFLKDSLVEVIDLNDADAVGEVLDSLKSFGLSDRHALIRRGVDFLLSTQNPDGSWGDADTEDVYERYHPTLTAVNGLRDYSWKEQRLVFPRLLPELKRWSRAGRQ
ncbi:MAG TPA: hypothetical protein VGP08_06460 [Pyrinomonadaceae bacterium]|jgi:hypothetical protein|nr:hypothetical protein [Pyrinomonadaceae bacterium]